MSRSGRASDSASRMRSTSRDYSPDRYGRRGSAPGPDSQRGVDDYARNEYPSRMKNRRNDSYYDPRDKYYLSGDEDEDRGYRASSRDRTKDLDRDRDRDRDQDRNRDRESSRRPPQPSRTGSRDGYRDYAGGRRSSASSASSAPSSYRGSRSGAGARGRDGDRDRYYPPSSSRTKDARAGKRPGASRTNSSSRSTSSGGGGSSKSTNSKTPAAKSNSALSKAVRVALEAGAVAALKQRHDPSPWIGMKGTKVAAAAIGAAAIDTFMDRKAPKRKGGMSHLMMKQATTMALGNLVLGPAAKGTVMGRTRR